MVDLEKVEEALKTFLLPTAAAAAIPADSHKPT
jgi:hypothetical protein